MMVVQVPFKSPTAAIVHVFNDERQGGTRPASARLTDKWRGDVPEFGGLDGGAEKATALDMLTKGLTKVQLAALRARYAPRQRRCPCCNQHRLRARTGKLLFGNWLPPRRPRSTCQASEGRCWRR